MSREIVLAADLGGTNLRMAAIDHTGKILYRTKCDTPSQTTRVEEIVQAIVEAASPSSSVGANTASTYVLKTTPVNCSGDGHRRVIPLSKSVASIVIFSP